MIEGGVQTIADLQYTIMTKSIRKQKHKTNRSGLFYLNEKRERSDETEEKNGWQEMWFWKMLHPILHIFEVIHEPK